MGEEMRAILLLMIVFLSGCAGRQIIPQDMSNLEQINLPEIGVETSAGIGDRLVAKGKRKTGYAVELLDTVQFNKAEGESSILTCAVSVDRGIYFQSGLYKTSLDKCFGPVRAYISESDGSSSFNCNSFGGMVSDICKVSDGGYYLAMMMNKFELKQDFDKLEVGTKAVESPDNFIQELLYNGRVGNEIKFIYREFSNDHIRPAFSQSVQYDLNESKVIGFKALRLEVIEATNTQIKYKLIHNF